MCDDEQRSAETEHNKTNSRLSLLDLPVEIFFHICSFLDASTLVHGLSLVCKQFHEILNDNSMWKVRINHIWPNTDYPVLPPDEDDELFWKLSCVALERQSSIWKDVESMDRMSLGSVQYSTIDGLLLMEGGQICISGARDRSLMLWKLPTEENNQESIQSIDFAHDGWIWDLTAIDNTVYSCSWDQTVKAWTLTNTELALFKTYEMIVSGALLCVASCPELPLFATGSFCRTVLVFDTRLGCNPIVKFQPHKRAVIRLSMSSNFILSASEDRTVAIWDQRAGRLMKNVTISQESFPMSMCMRRDMVYVGDCSAKLHVLDPKKGFELVKCYSTGHKKGISGVHVGPGYLITSSTDETVRISSPTDPPQHIVTLQTRFGEVASIDYSNDVLAISGTDGIEVYRARMRCT
ncbi:F-box/WD repeat-containing protein 9-like isoform X1 [Colletes gigas]|uniref:F-box/WD repeat-containing protein 9-like isoform X1 n=1 Tax=Colletes gigas TaxID=935657 RepID=UPI001C9A7CA4|nr:F-box/WD repeat-containing protein 9-like isoform X1 [Colletes gigas]